MTSPEAKSGHIRLTSHPRGPARFPLRWDALLDNGEEAPSGAYFFRLATPEGDCTGRILLVR